MRWLDSELSPWGPACTLFLATVFLNPAPPSSLPTFVELDVARIMLQGGILSLYNLLLPMVSLFPTHQTQCSKHSKPLSVTKWCSLSSTGRPLHLDLGESKRNHGLQDNRHKGLSQETWIRSSLYLEASAFIVPSIFLLQPFHLVNFRSSLN